MKVEGSSDFCPKTVLLFLIVYVENKNKCYIYEVKNKLGLYYMLNSAHKLTLAILIRYFCVCVCAWGCVCVCVYSTMSRHGLRIDNYIIKTSQ